MFGNLFVKKIGSQSLDSFVSEMSNQLGCGKFEERQSSNYVDERYFRRATLGIVVEIALADEPEFDSCDFWISFQPDSVHLEDKSFFDGLADCVARKLAICGWQVIRPLSFGRAGGGAILYRLNPASNSSIRERVIVEDV
jgi:hypothetical protein